MLRCLDRLLIKSLDRGLLDRELTPQVGDRGLLDRELTPQDESALSEESESLNSSNADEAEAQKAQYGADQDSRFKIQDSPASEAQKAQYGAEQQVVDVSRRAPPEMEVLRPNLRRMNRVGDKEKKTIGDKEKKTIGDKEKKTIGESKGEEIKPAIEQNEFRGDTSRGGARHSPVDERSAGGLWQSVYSMLGIGSSASPSQSPAPKKVFPSDLLNLKQKSLKRGRTQENESREQNNQRGNQENKDWNQESMGAGGENDEWHCENKLSQVQGSVEVIRSQEAVAKKQSKEVLPLKQPTHSCQTQNLNLIIKYGEWSSFDAVDPVI